MKSIAWTLLLFSAVAFAQNATDGGKPADGAIIRKGEMLPGETAATPDGRANPSPSARGIERCAELSGSPREECLGQDQKAAAGATRTPGEPPPQNPRQEKQ